MIGVLAELKRSLCKGNADGCRTQSPVTENWPYLRDQPQGDRCPHDGHQGWQGYRLSGG